MKNASRANIVLWLSEMKQKGKARLNELNKEFEAGRVEAYVIIEARKRYDCILSLLEIFQECRLEPNALLQLVKRMSNKEKQGELFSAPKNPI